MRRIPLVLLSCVLVACGGDDTPLKPLAVGPQWMPVLLDTAGNIVMRRMAIWVDTANVGASPAGFALASQRMQMDMKIGGMSTTMQMRHEIDCAGKRFRTVGIDSMSAVMNGTPLPDSIARQALAQQSAKASDTTWQSISSTDGPNGSMLTAVCAKAAAGVPTASK
ncbi:MAG: hypothetical protein U5K74_16435 [Gemmatimonadaceae bacterium]|nr:hypothetical protein [Gemmatimonadaceae bacterium]